MINLDDYTAFRALDPQGMLEKIDRLPYQLRQAWELGRAQVIPETRGIRNIVIAGMGGSGLCAELASAYLAPICALPVFLLRDYDLPAWASGPATLVIACSHSGDTEETLSAFQQGYDRGCRLLALCTGGALKDAARSEGSEPWLYTYPGQSRTAVGWIFGLLLAAFSQMNVLSTSPQELYSQLVRTETAMLNQQESLKADIPISRNPAKRLAGQLYGRTVLVMASGHLAPVARRWKGQLNEVAKAWSQFEFLPEANHNSLAGLANPADLFSRVFALFLRSPSDHPRNRMRSDLTRETFMLEGINTDQVDARGDSPLAHIWTALNMGDYTAYYLAMMYGVDPTPTSVDEFKNRMGEID